MTALAHRFGYDSLSRPVVMHIAGCALAFGAVLAGGIHLADSADWGGLARSRALLEVAIARAAAAERVLAEASRHRAAHAGTGDSSGVPAAPGWPAVLLELAELAASSGLQVVALEPQAGQDAKPGGRRTVRIDADGGFPALRRMIDGLAALPVLVVPAAMRAERDSRTARVTLSLDVFPALRGGEAVYGDGRRREDSADADPFGVPTAPGAGSAPPSRLAGVMRDARAGLALFDDGMGAITAVAAGDAVGAMRVMRVEPDAVMLATASGPRRMALDDGGAQW
ncbi:pilus assembly protein [Burkholderia sp. JSH-S8]|uniref:pilus assembly protein n=1 Tax=Burkholderia stagnalis TaxID=1503054 RepID=UPI000F80BB6B|nr:pilus assembly protein [Burkholderia stagnalis]WGS42352.1 pilus assembly protein [Burkholderia sp. JSH-S8]